jgi:hypothetical protein
MSIVLKNWHWAAEELRAGKRVRHWLWLDGQSISYKPGEMRFTLELEPGSEAERFLGVIQTGESIDRAMDLSAFTLMDDGWELADATFIQLALCDRTPR